MKIKSNVRYGSLADMPCPRRNVCFTPKSGHCNHDMECRLRANSRHASSDCNVAAHANKADSLQSNPTPIFESILFSKQVELSHVGERDHVLSNQRGLIFNDFFDLGTNDLLLSFRKGSDEARGQRSINDATEGHWLVERIALAPAKSKSSIVEDDAPLSGRFARRIPGIAIQYSGKRSNPRHALVSYIPN